MNNDLSISSLTRLSVIAVAIAAMVGCSRTPVPDTMPSDVPADWQGPIAEDAEIWPNVDWWNNFESEELTALLKLVRANNFDYKSNLRNLRQAQIQLEQAGVDLWPSPSVSISTGASTSVSQTQAGSSSGSSNGPFNLGASASTGSILSKPLNYERALNDYESRLASTSNAALNTMGTAARAYFQLLSQRDAIEATRRNIEVAELSRSFTEARVNAGVEIPINLQNQTINVLRLQNTLTSQLQQDFQLRASLALLIGRGVQDFDIEGQSMEGVALPSVMPGLPSELLFRRPDIVQAEYSLKNAAISVDVARLSFFPSISLNGSANASSPSLIDIVADPLTTSVSLSSSLAMTLLDNGSRKRNLEQTRLSLETALDNYRRTLITAFNDIEVKLNNIQLLKDQGLVIERQEELAIEQHRLAELRYRQGTANFQTLLNAENDLFGARNSVLSSRLSQINAMIDFYQSLGGGWEAGEILLENPEYANVQ